MKKERKMNDRAIKEREEVRDRMQKRVKAGNSNAELKQKKLSNLELFFHYSVIKSVSQQNIFI